MQITKENLRVIRAAIDAALVPVSAQLGLTSLKAGNASFDSTGGNFVFKLEGIAEGGQDVDATRYAASMWLGLPPLGFVFKSGGKSYATCGLNTTGSKIIGARQPDGKKFIFHVDDVKRQYTPVAA